MLVLIVTSLFHLVLPLAWLGWLAARTPRSWITRALALSGSAFYVALLVWAGAGWGLLGWYTRWVLLAVTIPLWLLGAARARRAPRWPRGLGSWLSAASALGVALMILASLLELASASRPNAAGSVDVQSPLLAGTYLVAQGGEHESVNHHSNVTAQRHALDIVGLNAFGFGARSLGSAQLSDYVIYGAELSSPCAGEVLVARDGLDDLPVGLPSEAGLKAPLGNTVLLYCPTNDITVVLAHMKPHSLRVAAGNRVAVGAELGAVGNSGNTSEPHLHIHAVKGRVTDPLLAITGAEPVRLRIDGRLMARNDRLAGTHD